MTSSPAKSTLRVLCSGTGYFSQFHYEAWTRLPAAQIVGVVNRSADKAQEFAQKYDIAESFSGLELALQTCKPDVLDIITPPVTHLSAVKLAAKYGVDAICQKPFGENKAQAQAMVDIAEEAGIKLVIHENFRFMPWYRKIKTLLRDGAVGQPLNVTFKLRPGDGQGAEAYLSRQPYFQEMPKFLVHETAIHLVDTFRFLFGEPLSVYADLRRCNPVIKGEDAGLIVFEYPNQLRALFDGNRLLDHAATNTRRTMGELEIAGTAGVISLDGEGEIQLRKFGELQSQAIAYDWQDQHFGGDCVFLTIEHICQALLSQSTPENQGKDYINNIIIEETIYRSAEKGIKIAL